MRRQQYKDNGSAQPYELIWYFDYDNNLIERVSGVNMSGYSWASRTGYRFAQDPEDNQRYVLRRPTDGNKGLQPPFLVINNEKRYLGPSGANGTNVRVPLVGKTMEFYWYAGASSSTSPAYIWCNTDSCFEDFNSFQTNLGYDLYRSGNTLYVVARHYDGSPTEDQIQLGSFATGKWYRVVIDYVDLTGSYKCRYRLYDGDSLVIDSDNVQLPAVTLSSALNSLDRIGVFFNSHYGYYAKWPNNTDFLKEFKLYRRMV